MKLKELNRVIENTIRKVLKEVDNGPIDPKRIYIAIQDVAGDLGTMKKGEIFIKYKSVDGPDYVHLNIANPGYDYSEDIEVSEFKSSFRQLDPEKDILQMKLLNKWGILEFGDKYYVLSFDFKYNRSTASAIDTLKERLKRVKVVSAESPKLAMKKAGYEKAGTVQELINNKLWISKFYADWVIVVSTVDLNKLEPKLLLKLISKSGLIHIG